MPSSPLPSFRQTGPSTLAVTLCLALCLLGTTAIAAQTDNSPTDLGDRPVFPVVPVPAGGEIEVDGRIDEAAWGAKPTFTLDYETFPGDNVAPPVETEVWITHDEGQLYIAFRAHDPDPSRIRARLRDRDAAFQDDFVGVALDTFDDERRAFEFFVNPLGVQMDLVQNDVTGSEDASWDALWSSAGRLTEQGYEVEMAIPFSSLRFARGDGPKRWGIDAIRYWPRDQRRRISVNQLRRGANCYLCQIAKLEGFAGIKPGRNIEIVPTVTASDTTLRGGPGGGSVRTDDQEAGLTAHWGITPGTTLSGTLNPDFSQVEADAAQLTVNNQFALFLPEKRPFFLEGADLFETRINAVYTRTIADPAWGGKVTGKMGKSAYGVIVAEDEQTSLVIPGSQGSRFAFLDQESTSSVLRYRRDLPGSSALGGLVTTRDGDGYHNHLAGIDGIFRWGGGNAFRLELLGSDTSYPEAIREVARQSDGDSLQGHALRLGAQRQTANWTASLVYFDVADDFRADLGFIPQAGYRSGFGIYQYTWYGGEEKGKAWTRLGAGVETTWTYDHDGEPLQQQIAPFASINGPRQSFLNVYLGFGPSYFRGQELDRNFVNLFGEIQATPDVQLSFDSRVGQEIDYSNAQGGDLVRFKPRARFDLGRHLRLTLAHNYETLDVEGGRLYTANLSDLRATYQFNVRTFVRLVTQYYDLSRDPALYGFPTNAQSKDLSNQFLVSYKVNPQTVLFVGYADNYQGFARSVDELDQTGRTLFLKVGYAWVL